MKKTILILISLLTFACQHTERSIGFTSLENDGEEYKFYLGTDSTIEVVKKFDQISKTKNYEELRKIFSDTAKFTYYNGVENTLDEFITLNQKRDSTLLANGETLTWSPQWALSVDINTKFETLLIDANLANSKVPSTLFFNPSIRLYSTIGTCLYAAAW